MALARLLFLASRTARLHRATCDLSLLALISLNQLSLAVRLQVKLVSRSLNRSIVEYPLKGISLSSFLCAYKGNTVRIQPHKDYRKNLPDGLQEIVW